MNNKTELELKRLNDIAVDSLSTKGVNLYSTKYEYKIFSKYLKKGTVLELGSGEGIMTDELMKNFDDITIVEGASHFAEIVQAKHPTAKVIHSLFEDFKPEKKYDNIVLGSILENVEQPIDLLKSCGQWLKDAGVIVANVPNHNSIHKQTAVLMNLLSDTKEFSEASIHHGHRRVYDMETFKKNFIDSGLKIKACGGYWLKPISNKQIDDSWTEEMINAFRRKIS